MKTYEPRRDDRCPNPENTGHSPYGSGQPDECTCPWLIIQSTTPVQHLTSWNRRELDNVIREMDNGYFDPPGYPRRERSMFLSPGMQRLLDVAEKEPVAAALTLLAGAGAGTGLPPFDAIAWDAEDGCLSLRVGNAGGWRRLWLGHANVDTITDQDATTAGGTAPVLVWADHPDTWAEIGGTGALFARLPEVSPDVYAEGEDTLAECQRTGTCCGTCNADFGTCCTHDEAESRRVVAMAQDAADVAANSATARIMGDYMPLILTVPADEIPNLKPGNPIYDAAMTAVEALPRRVPRVPSDIAQAASVSDRCGDAGRCFQPRGHVGNHYDKTAEWPGQAAPRYAPDVID